MKSDGYLRWCCLLWTRLAWSHHVGLQQGTLSFQIVILDQGMQIWSYVWRVIFVRDYSFSLGCLVV